MRFIKYLPWLSLWVLLTGCDPSNMQHSVPELMRDGLILETKQVSADDKHAKVTMRVAGGPLRVGFSVSRDGGSSEYVGAAIYNGRGEVLPWIAKTIEKVNSVAFRRQPELQILAEADKPLVVVGLADSPESSYYCGSLQSKFTPEANKVYLVEFRFIEGGCNQKVFDITQSGDPVALVPEGAVPVPSKSIR